MPRPLARYSLAAVVLLSSSSGCMSCAQQGLGMIQGPINDPTNRQLRRDILSYGIGQFCGEMLKRSAPLALQPDQPAVGRFFPQTCATQKLDNGDLQVSFGGVGYAWTNVSKKVGFTMQGTVVYDDDFLMSGSTMYAYFRPRQIQASNFQTRSIEQPVANVLAQLTSLGDNFGKQLVATELNKGFTVIREADGTADFALGVVEKGKRPAHPYDLHGSSRIAVANARVEVHQNQRDFVGPIVVEDDGRALYLTASLDGAPAAELLVMRKDEAEASIGYYTGYPAAGPLAGAPLVSDVLEQGRPYTRTLPVPRGTYYVLLDNTSTAGRVAPQQALLDDRAAVISHVVQIGDAPSP